MRVVQAVTHYDLLTGSGIYVYELSRVLASRGHLVTVLGENVGGLLTRKTRELGIDVRHVDDHMVGHLTDVVHVHQAAPGMVALSRWPKAAAVATVHSPWPGDQPIVSERIGAYLCVRPEIRTKVLAVDRADPGLTEVVFNGIDRLRFRPGDSRHGTGRRTVLFAATFSPLRAPAVLHLIRRSVEEDFDVVLLGPGDPQLLGRLPRTVRWERREEWHVEDYVRDVDEVAGTFVGRTALEGWMCAKPSWVYEVEPFQDFTSVTRYPPPPPMFLDVCDIEYMTDIVERFYAAAIQRSERNG